jgi:hypothetical protein
MPLCNWLIIGLVILTVLGVVTAVALWAAGAINKDWPD